MKIRLNINKEKYIKELQINHRDSEVNIKQLEKLANEYKIKAQAKGRVVSDAVKQKRKIYHANEKIAKEKLEDNRKFILAASC